jgi:hypothetical protein
MTTTGITSSFLAEQNTMLPYYAMLLRPGTLSRIESALAGGPDMPVPKMLWISCGPLRLCPCCAQEDKSAFGEAYWHRIHQLPGIAICAKHGAPLRACNAGAGELMPTSHAAGRKDVELLFSPLQKGKLLNVAKESEWALGCGISISRRGSGEEKIRRLSAEAGY